MMSAIIRVRKSDGTFIEARALLDTCATAHFMTETLAQQLGLPTQPCSIPINTINEMTTVSRDLIQITFRALHSDFQKTLTCLTVSRITDSVPDEVFPRESLKIPANIHLADPEFHIPRPVDILIGSGTTLSLMSIGQISLSRDDCDLVLQKTQLGWVVVGGILDNTENRIISCNLSELKEQIAKFWVIENVDAEMSNLSEKSLCETHYSENTTRNDNGRYVVRLPFRAEGRNFGDMRRIALRRFHALQRKLNTNSALKEEYHKVMEEYVSLGHMSLVNDDSSSRYYLPHHAVVKATSATTKTRVVFDASAKSSNNISLNDELMVGPTIQDKLFEHLLRFRTHSHVMTADIEKMYRQILIHPQDRKYQRIFWYHENRIRTFELNTVTFGVSSAPYLAIRTVQQLADDEGTDFPYASEILRRDLYVDDLLTGANSLEEALRIRDEVISLLKRGGFNIRQWASNHNHVLDSINEKVLGTDYATDKNPVKKNSRHWMARAGG